MRSTAALGLSLAAFAWVNPAEAQLNPAAPQGGYAVDRLYLSAPGGGWFVMDALDMRGGLGWDLSLTTSYARDPLRVQQLTVVSDEALADLGLAATFDRLRLYVDLNMPLTVRGQGGTVDGNLYVPPTVPNGNWVYESTPTYSGYVPARAPGVTPVVAPGVLADTRVGLDVRFIGPAEGPFRLGMSAQLLVPSPGASPYEYITDGTVRGMGRVLFAGDIGLFTYAGQVGIHFRSFNDYSPDAPQGSELLFGIAGGMRLATGLRNAWALVLGPEVWGESAFHSPSGSGAIFGPSATGVEGLLSGRLEGTADDGAQMRVKLGVGAGLDAQFGVPEWRAVVAVEVFDHRTGHPELPYRPPTPTRPTTQ
jgi:hypothetical protein